MTESDEDEDETQRKILMTQVQESMTLNLYRDYLIWHAKHAVLKTEEPVKPQQIEVQE